MQDVRVIGVESGALLLATDGGSEFRLPITSDLPGQVRQANPDHSQHKRVSPKDVQARIRAGASADEVATVLGVEPEYVRRFEGPVLAERAFILDSARRVAVSPADEEAPDTFGPAIDARLEAGGATDIHWASWKNASAEQGWQIQVRYTATDVDYDAQWQFDPKTTALSPDNADAHRLSQHDEHAGITPRLRAVDFAAEDDTRFDSGAFVIEDTPAPTTETGARAPLPRIGSAPVEQRLPGNETADLLEALRRRRGEREAATFGDDPEQHTGDSPQHGQQRAGNVVDVELDFGPADVPNADLSSPAPEPQRTETRSEARKRNRRSMPSWDEIVFGTRPDDDLA